jgi:hypothetical protein
MANITVYRTLPATTTLNFLDPRTKKVIATVTSTTAGSYSVSVPPGEWIEQIVRTLPEPGGANRVFTATAPHLRPISRVRQRRIATRSDLTSPDGSVWQLQVANNGTVSATKLV